MTQKSITNKWMENFNKYEALQDFEEFESDVFTASFKEDYCNLNENDKEELWNFYLSRKRFYRTDTDRYNILFEMYREDALNNYPKLSDDQKAKLDKIDKDISNLQLPDFHTLFPTAPYIMLEIIIEHFRVFSWKEFSRLNISSLNNESTLRILDNSKIFGDLPNINHLNPMFDIIHDEPFHNLSSEELGEYIKRYAKDLQTPILKKIDISHDYLFCPEIVNSIMPLVKDDDKINISGNIIDTHVKLIELKNQGFVIPKVFNTNILLLKKYHINKSIVSNYYE
ncbi:hypothetical protein ACFL3O_01330 [Candidatus Neomarinimicrobiota bacterium]